MDPNGFPTNLPEFQQVFPNDDACAKYLETMRWPNGFTCPKCGQTGEPYPKVQGQYLVDQWHCHAVHTHATFDLVLGGFACAPVLRRACVFPTKRYVATTANLSEIMRMAVESASMASIYAIVVLQ
jgi:hypothetical protein